MRDAQESGLSMLSEQYLNYDEGAGGRLHPRWLTALDDDWLDELANAACAITDCTVEEADTRVFEQVCDRVGRQGVSRRLIEAIWLVERRRWQKQVVAPIVPERLRRLLFDKSAEVGASAAIGIVARDLDLEEHLLRSALFADRPSARRLVPPRELPTKRLLRERFNLALLDGFVVRASELVARVPSHAHAVVLHARQLHLMAEVRERDDMLEIAISGPLALFHRTTKYGNMLVTWLPTLLATECWTLACKIRLRGEERYLMLDDHAPLARERSGGTFEGTGAIERELRRLGTGWRLDRQSRIVRARGHLFFADFTLADAVGRRVGVEVVGYWTPELLAARERLLEAAEEPMLLCADRCHGDVATGPRVLLFERRIDVAALVAACAAVLG